MMRRVERERERKGKKKGKIKRNMVGWKGESDKQRERGERIGRRGKGRKERIINK